MCVCMCLVIVSTYVCSVYLTIVSTRFFVNRPKWYIRLCMCVCDMERLNDMLYEGVANMFDR